MLENLGRLFGPFVRPGRGGGLRRLMKERLAGSLGAVGVNPAFQRGHDQLVVGDQHPRRRACDLASPRYLRFRAGRVRNVNRRHLARTAGIESPAGLDVNRQLGRKFPHFGERRLELVGITIVLANFRLVGLRARGHFALRQIVARHETTATHEHLLASHHGHTELPQCPLIRRVDRNARPPAGVKLALEIGLAAAVLESLVVRPAHVVQVAAVG